MHVHLLRVFALSVHHPVHVLDGRSTVNTQINQSMCIACCGRSADTCAIDSSTVSILVWHTLQDTNKKRK